MSPRARRLLRAIAGFGLPLAAACGGTGAQPATDAGVSPDVREPAPIAKDSGVGFDAGDGGEDARLDAHDASTADSSTLGFGCGAGTKFCNSSCGICLLTGTACGIDSCGVGNSGETCAVARCGDGTLCVSGECRPR